MLFLFSCLIWTYNICIYIYASYHSSWLLLHIWILDTAYSIYRTTNRSYTIYNNNAITAYI